jgi:hypothetical protein
MSQFLRSVIQQDVTLTASSQTDLIDLPVNPISFILFTVRGLNNTTTASNYRFINGFVDFIKNIEVLYRGQNIIQGSLQDLSVVNAILTGFTPNLGNAVYLDNYFRSMTFMLSFSRVPFWQEECFPATTRGELQMRVTTGAYPSHMDFLQMQVETVELLGAEPSRFLKYTTYNATASSVGELDRDLPRGNSLAGVLLSSAALQQTTSGVDTIEQVRLLVDNVETYYALSNFESLHGELRRRIASPFTLQSHHHLITSTSSFILSAFDSGQPQYENAYLERYGYLDFDPLKDGNYLLDTRGAGRVAMRIKYGDGNAASFIPIEVIELKKAS